MDVNRYLKSQHHTSRSFQKPRWDHQSPAWIKLDSNIPHGHLVRVVAPACDTHMFDDEQLLDLYSGRGSQAHDPRLLLKFVVYKHAGLSKSLPIAMPSG